MMREATQRHAPGTCDSGITRMNQMRVMLRPVQREDLEILFRQVNEPEGMRMVGSVRDSHTDRDAYMARWETIFANAKVIPRAIVLPGGDGRDGGDGRGGSGGGEVIAGSIACFERVAEPSRPCRILPGPEIGYWLGRAFWGQGIASEAVRLFLGEVTTRPLFARAASDNVGSIRVLEKAGFMEIGREMFFANMRGADGKGEEIEETLMVVGLTG